MYPCIYTPVASYNQIIRTLAAHPSPPIDDNSMASSWNNPAIFLAAALAVATAAQVVTAGFTTDLYWQQQPAPGAVTPYKTSDWHDGSATFYGDPSGMGDDFGT